MKFRAYINNPFIGVCLTIGIVLLLYPLIFSTNFPAYFQVSGVLVICVDILLFINQFKKRISITEYGNIEINKDAKNALNLYKPYKLTCFWGYNNFLIPFGRPNYKGSNNSYAEGNRIRTCLNILLEDASGNKVLFYQNLLPWQELPKGWEYNVILSDIPPKINVFKIHQMIAELKKHQGLGGGSYSQSPASV
ncbi:MAG: hypothetical protein KDC34_20695 [Saprospiraceae bacterium]|nr:hypothetical protein [Saprospiraceae bacterium]